MEKLEVFVHGCLVGVLMITNKLCLILADFSPICEYNGCEPPGWMVQKCIYCGKIRLPYQEWIEED